MTFQKIRDKPFPVVRILLINHESKIPKNMKRKYRY